MLQGMEVDHRIVLDHAFVGHNRYHRRCMHMQQIADSILIRLLLEKAAILLQIEPQLLE